MEFVQQADWAPKFQMLSKHIKNDISSSDCSELKQVWQDFNECRVSVQHQKDVHMLFVGM